MTKLIMWYIEDSSNAKGLKIRARPGWMARMSKVYVQLLPGLFGFCSPVDIVGDHGCTAHRFHLHLLIYQYRFGLIDFFYLFSSWTP